MLMLMLLMMMMLMVIQNRMLIQMLTDDSNADNGMVEAGVDGIW
jgi:hypothetical protein